MNEQAQELLEVMLQTDQEFHQFAVKHHELEGRLHQLAEQPCLSEPEQFEKVNLKKRKRQLKDRMEDIFRNQRQRESPVSPMSDPSSPPRG